MIRNAQYSELNRAVMDQDRALDELMRNHKNTCQSNKREHRASLPAKKPRSIHSEYVPDDDMSLTLVKLRIQQEKAKRLQKQYEQEQLQLQMQQQHKQQRYAKRTEEKSNNNVIVIDVPSNTTLIIRSLPSSHQKPSIMKLSSSNKLVQLLKSFKPHKGTLLYTIYFRFFFFTILSRKRERKVYTTP
jgi:hypothetical protein